MIPKSLEDLIEGQFKFINFIKFRNKNSNIKELKKINPYKYLLPIFFEGMDDIEKKYLERIEKKELSREEIDRIKNEEVKEYVFDVVEKIIPLLDDLLKVLKEYDPNLYKETINLLNDIGQYDSDDMWGNLKETLDKDLGEIEF